MNRRSGKNDAGISDIVGTITLLAITVTLVGVAVAGFYSAGQSTQKATPQLDVKAAATPGASSVRLIHAGGTALDRATLTYKVTAGGTVIGNGTFPNPGLGTWDIGQAVDLPLQQALATDGKQTVEISVVSKSVGAVVASSTVHVGSANAAGSTTPAFSILAVSPASATRAQGDSLTIIAWLHHDGGRKAITDAWIDLSPINGSAHAPLHDDGTDGDAVAGDMNYTADITIPGGAIPSGTAYALRVNATDADGNYTGPSSSVVAVTVIPGTGGGSGGSGGTTIVCSVSPCTINTGTNGTNGTNGNPGVGNITCNVSPCTVNQGGTNVTCSVSPCTVVEGNTTITCSVSPCTILDGGTGFPPSITGFSPASGTPSTLVNVTGNNLSSITSVSFLDVSGGTWGVGSWWVDSAGALHLYPSDTAPSGSYRIVVSNPSGSSTSAGSFALTSGLSSPPSGAHCVTPCSGFVAEQIQVTGENLDQVRRVTLNNSALKYTADAAWWLQGTQLTFVIPVSAVPTGTTPNLFNVDLAGSFTGTTRLPEQLTVKVEPGPIVGSFSPTRGEPFTQVTLTGQNFVNVTGVTMNGTPVYFTAVSPTQLLVVTHAGVPPGNYSFNVTTGTTSTPNYAVSSCCFTALPLKIIPIYNKQYLSNFSVNITVQATDANAPILNATVKLQAAPGWTVTAVQITPVNFGWQTASTTTYKAFNAAPMCGPTAGVTSWALDSKTDYRLHNYNSIANELDFYFGIVLTNGSTTTTQYITTTTQNQNFILPAGVYTEAIDDHGFPTTGVFTSCP